MNYLATKSYLNNVDRMFNQFYTGRPAAVQKGFKVDIAETSDGYQIFADLPGFTAEDVDVRVEENLLVIEAEVLENTDKKDETEEKLNWYVRERKQGSLKRSFVLPEDVNKSGVEAEMKNGVLSVNLTKKPEAKPFTVKVQGK